MKLMVIGAHSDDAEIACGGTMAKAVASGHDVSLLVLSDSAQSGRKVDAPRTRETAVEEGLASAGVLGLSGVRWLDYPDTQVPYDAGVVQSIEEHIDEVRPDVIFAHWPHDTHQDHRRGALATLSAARWFPSIVMFEPMMPSGRSYAPFRPQLYVDVSDFMAMKIEALKAHASQHERFGEDWLDAIVARCRLRGFEAGVEYAEAFEAVRLSWM